MPNPHATQRSSVSDDASTRHISRVSRTLDAVFLDRDGTLNARASGSRYITSPAQLRLLPGVASAVRRLNEAGICAIVVTNQRGVALGLMTLKDVQKVNDAIQLGLRPFRAHIDAFYVCPHLAGTCTCRKPAPGLILQAIREHPGVRLERSVVIGDNETDIQASIAVGCRGVRLGPPGTQTRAHALYPDLRIALRSLLDPRRR